jgi:ABC-type multidrug transport system fused ATPase/permease subunit
VFAPSLAIVVLVGALLYAALRWASYMPLRQASAEAIVWAARRDGHFLETLRGIKTIKLFNGQEGRRSHWLNLLVETTNRQLTTQKMQLLFKIANSFVIGGLAILVVWIGASRVLANTFSVGMLLAFIAYKDQFLDRVSDLINKGLDLQMLRLHVDRLADLALTPPEPRDPVANFGPRRLRCDRGARSSLPLQRERPVGVERRRPAGGGGGVGGDRGQLRLRQDDAAQAAGEPAAAIAGGDPDRRHAASAPGDGALPGHDRRRDAG